jgi:hypothetical protein
MPVDFDSFTLGPGDGDAAPLINAAYSQGYTSVRVVGTLTVRSPIRIPQNRILYSEGPQYIQKGFNGPMCIMESWSEMMGLFWLGNGGTYDGPGILCEANTARQVIARTRITDMRGPCVDMSGFAAGAYASIGGGELCLMQRNDFTLPAIVLPADEPGTTGVRRIVGISGGGSKLIDLGGSNVTMLQNCDTYRIEMGARCRYGLFLSNRFAIPAGEVMVVRGSNHRFGFNTTSERVHFSVEAIGCSYEANNYDAGVVFDVGTTYNVVGHMALVPAPIDNSGNDLNRVEVTVAI